MNSDIVGANRSPLTEVWVWLVVFLTLLPFIWLVGMSFKSPNDIFAGSSRLLFTPTLEN